MSHVYVVYRGHRRWLDHGPKSIRYYQKPPDQQCDEEERLEDYNAKNKGKNLRYESYIMILTINDSIFFIASVFKV